MWPRSASISPVSLPVFRLRVPDLCAEHAFLRRFVRQSLNRPSVYVVCL